MSAGKRALDLCGASLGLLALWPLFLAVALLIKLGDRGPVFFRQDRVGHKGKCFRIWKFRTMVQRAESLGPGLTVGEDPRVTRAGRWLRHLRIDELPQLVNVLVGEMSLVGPRPELPRYVALYDQAQRRVLDLVPGITDPASIEFRNESERLASAADPEKTYIQDIMPAKIGINLAYAERTTLAGDVAVILRTLGVLLGISR